VTVSIRATAKSAGEVARAAKFRPSKYESVRNAVRLVAVDLAVADDLVVRIAVRDLGCPAPVAHEWDVGQGEHQIGHEAGRASATPPPWLPPFTAMRPGSTSGLAPRALHGPDGVGR